VPTSIGVLQLWVPAKSWGPPGQPFQAAPPYFSDTLSEPPSWGGLSSPQGSLERLPHPTLWFFGYDFGADDLVVSHLSGTWAG
jgi:hypothetical protein